MEPENECDRSAFRWLGWNVPETVQRRLASCFGPCYISVIQDPMSIGDWDEMERHTPTNALWPALWHSSARIFVASRCSDP
jgi:hypothetical protein